MQLHNLKRNRSNRKSKQVGRGGTRGKTSGRGTKGQNARAGRKKRPEMRDIIKRFPKLRGRGKNYLKSIQIKPFSIKVGFLDSRFSAGEVVNHSTLVEKGLVERGMRTKIVSGGEVNKKLIVSGIPISTGAREAIEKVGGKIE